MITRMEHVGLSVSDLDRSIKFYTENLGMNCIRVLECDADSKLWTVIAIHGRKARIAHLMCGDTMLELFEYQDPRGNKIPPDHRQADNGFVHMGIASNDTRADYARLRAAGVEFLSEPVEFRPGVWICYFKGPDGEICEIRQT